MFLLIFRWFPHVSWIFCWFSHVVMGQPQHDPTVAPPVFTWLADPDHRALFGSLRAPSHRAGSGMKHCGDGCCYELLVCQHTQNYGKSPCLMGKLTISTGPFSIAVRNYQRVRGSGGCSWDSQELWWFQRIVMGNRSPELVSNRLWNTAQVVWDGHGRENHIDTAVTGRYKMGPPVELAFSWFMFVVDFYGLW